MRIKLNKVFCLLAILALLCCGVALAENMKPTISLDQTSVTRGEYVTVTVDTPVDGEDIYYRAFVLNDGEGGLEDDNIRADAWGDRSLRLPTLNLEEGTYNVFAQAYRWDDENRENVLVGERSEAVTLTTTLPEGEHPIVLRTNRGSDFETPNALEYGRDVNYTVYAPGASKIIVYCNDDHWTFDGETANDWYWSDRDYTMQACALYWDDEGQTYTVKHSDVMTFTVGEPDGEMGEFTCTVPAVVSPEGFEGTFTASVMNEVPEGCDNTVYEVALWDMTLRSEDREAGDETVYISEVKIPNGEDGAFTIPTNWEYKGESKALEAGHAYRLEVNAWPDADASYRTATAHAAFIVEGGESVPEGRELSFNINGSTDDQTFSCGEDFEIRISAPEAVNVRVFRGEEYDNLNEREDWRDEYWDDEQQQTVVEGWSTHPEDIRYDDSHGWPVSFMFWAEVQYEDDDTWYRSNAVRLTITSDGFIDAPATVTAPDSVTRGDYLPVTVSGLDERADWVNAFLMDATGDNDDRIGEYDTDNLNRDGDTTLSIPTAEAPAGSYQLVVESGADGYQSTACIAWVTVEERDGDAPELVFNLSKAPDEEDNKIHLVPHEELGISVWMPEGGENSRVALLFDDDEEESEGGNVMTRRWNDDRNCEVEIKAVGWLNYQEDEEDQEPNYVSEPVTVVVDGESLADIAVSVDPAVYPWREGTETVDFSFNKVEGAESYYIRVENVSSENGYNVWEEDIGDIEHWDRVSVEEGIVTYRVPVHHDDGNDVFERDNLYNIHVSAFAYGRSTSDGEARTVALVEPADNTTMTVNGNNESATVEAHTTYRVCIKCEGADTFEFYDGEEWHEVHHGDGLNDEEREQAGDGDGVCEFNWDTGDSGTYVLTCRVKTAETDEDWTQGPVVTLTVTGKEIEVPDLDQFNIPETIKRGEDLVIRVPEGAIQHDGQQFGAHLIAANGNWLGYYHWDEEEGAIVYPTVAVGEGEYQVRVQTFAPGYDTNASSKDLTVVAGDKGEVYIYMEREETETCEDNVFSAYAPGAQRIRLLYRYDDGRNDEEFYRADGESLLANDISRGHSGEYRVCAEACYAGEEGGEDWYDWSEELTWRVYAPNGALDNVRIDVPAVIAPETEDLTFTVGEVPNGQYYNVHVWTDGENDVFGKDYDGCPGGITVEHKAEDDEVALQPVFHNGVYTVSAYVSARGYEDSYQEVRFLVSDNQAEGVSFRLLDEEGNEVNLGATDGSNEDAGLWTGRNYRVEMSGSSQALSVEFNRGDRSEFEHIEIQDSDYDGDRWTVRYPENELDWWNMGGGQYNLLVYVFDKEEMIGVAGQSVTVQSHGRLAVPNIEITDEDNTVVRGDYLHVHVDSVDNGQNYWAHIRGTYNGEEKDFYQTDNAIGDFVLPTAELHPTEVGWPAEAEVAYRVDVDVSAEGWDGNSNRARFNLQPKEDTEPVLAIAHDKDEEEDNKYYMWIDESLRASLCAPGAERVWIEITGVCEGLYDTWSDNLALGQGEQDFHPNRPGMITVVGHAEYPSDGGEEISRNTEPVNIQVSSLGRVSVPRIHAPETLGPDDESLTFSFDYSDMPEIPEEWEGWEDFDYNDHYAWQIERSDDFENWEQITDDWTDVQHEGEDSGGITFEDIEWSEGRAYRINVNAFANRCESNGDSYTVMCLSGTDESVTLEANPGGENPLDNLEHNEFVYLHITAPDSTERVELFDGNGWFDINPKEDEPWSDFTYDWRCHSGSYNLMVRAYYTDSEMDAEAVRDPSNAVYISAHSYGQLGIPEVTVNDDNVPRGECVELNIGHVENADGDDYRAEFYRFNVEAEENEQWSYVDGSNIDRLHEGSNQISTAGLKPGSYRVEVWATGIGWDDSDRATADFEVVEGKEPDENGFVINVTNAEPLASETWKATVYYLGDELDWGRLQLWVEDADGNPDNGFESRSITPNDMEASFNKGHSGTYAVCACVTVDDGEPIYAEPVEVTVKANGDLNIELVEVPAYVKRGEADEDGEVRRLETFEVKVAVDVSDSDTDAFSLNVHDQDGTTLYTPEPIPVSNADEDGIVAVELNVDTTANGNWGPTISSGTIINVDAYVSALGYNDSGDSKPILVVDEEPEYDENGFAISVTNDHPDTGETWKASVLCNLPGIEEGSMQLWIEDGNGGRDDGFDQWVNEENTMASASFNMGHSGAYTVLACVTVDGETIYAERPVEVIVEASNGQLNIALKDVPETVALTIDEDRPEGAATIDPFNVTVDVSDLREKDVRFQVRLHNGNGDVVFETEEMSGMDLEEGDMTVTLAPETIGGDLSDVQRLSVEANAWAAGYDDISVEETVAAMVMDNVNDDMVKLALAEGEDPSELWSGRDIRLSVNAGGALWANLCEVGGGSWSVNEGVVSETHWRTDDDSQHMLYVQAEFPDDDYDEEENPDAHHSVNSKPLTLDIRSLGRLDTPAVEVLSNDVIRGQFMEVEISPVEHADENGYCLVVCRYISDEDRWESIDESFMGGLSSGISKVPSAGLEPGRYRVEVWANGDQYTCSDSNTEGEFDVVENEAFDENGFLITVSEEELVTSVAWQASVYCERDDIVEGSLEFWLEDEDGNRDYGFDHQSIGENDREAWFNRDRSGTYTLKASVRVNDDTMEAEPKPVTISATEGSLNIALVEAPASVKLGDPDEDSEVRKLKPFAVKVDVSETEAETFSLFVDDQGGTRLYTLDSIPVSEAENGIVTVELNVDTWANDNWGPTISSGTIIYVNAHATAPGYDPADDSKPIMVMDSDESQVTLELAEGEDINDMWAGQEFRMRVHAPGAMWAFFKDEYGSEEPLELDKNGDAEITWCMGSGTHLLWVDAAYDAGDYDPDANPEAWYGVRSLPLSINFQCNGTLDAPEVTILKNSVTRGEFLPVQIGEVYAGEDLAERYEVQIWKIEEGEERLELDNYGSSYSVREISIPTDSLDPGEYYVRAAAFNARWDDLWSDLTEETRFTVQDAEEGLVLNVSTETATTLEQWWASAVYTGAPGCRIDMWVTDPNNPDDRKDADTKRDSDFDYGCASEAAWFIDYEGTYTVHAEVLDGDGNQVAQAEQEITIIAPKGYLEISVADAPRNVRPDEQEMEVSVYVSEDVEYLHLWIENNDGEWIYEQNDISTSDRDDNGIVKVTVPLDFEKNEGETFRLCVHTNRYGWNAAFDSKGVSVSNDLDYPETDEPMPSVMKGTQNIDIWLTHTDARAERTYATVEGSTQEYEPDENRIIVIPTDQLNPGKHRILVHSTGDGFEEQAIELFVRVLDSDAMLTLPKAMQTIGEEAFEGTNAEIVIIPDGATTIGSKAFANSAVGYVVIPDSVTEIADDAFEGCDSLVIECLYGGSVESYCERNGIYCYIYGE